MRWGLLLSATASVVAFAFAAQAQPPSRLSEHEFARQKLFNSNFYANGQGMHLSPGILNKLESFRSLIGGTKPDETVLQTLAHRWGLQNTTVKNSSGVVSKQLVGIKTVRYQNMKIGVLGCVACHSGKAAGQYIIGIGNKNIDPGQIGKDGTLIEHAFKKITDTFYALTFRVKSAEYKKVEASSIRLMEKLSNPTLSAETQGLVPVALVGSWFFEQAGAALPANGFKGATKVPSWFGFGKKLEVGQFSDAIGLGHPPGWILGVEIAAGQTPETVRENFSKVEEASEYISKLLPPKYPFAINLERAQKGKIAFEQTCAHCHGTYSQDQLGLPVYETPKMIPQSVIGTDPDRLDYVTEDFLQKVRSSPLSDLIQLSQYAGKRMYVAPRLHAIWARFPYLHNASVPTLRDLLEPASKRPKVFSLNDAGEKYRFDQAKVGLTKVEINQSDLNSAKSRAIYDTSKFGQSNQGHEKFLDLSNEQKDEIVEYLKTL